jgi:hypothetical protein
MRRPADDSGSGGDSDGGIVDLDNHLPVNQLRTADLDSELDAGAQPPSSRQRAEAHVPVGRRLVARRSSADDFAMPAHRGASEPGASSSNQRSVHDATARDDAGGGAIWSGSPLAEEDDADNSAHIRAARLISQQLYMNLPILEQWKRSVEAMNRERSCDDQSCRVCRWPRATTVNVNPCTGEVKCKAMQRKFREHLRIAQFDSTLRHLTIMLAGLYGLLGGYVFYTAGANGSVYVASFPFSQTKQQFVGVVATTNHNSSAQLSCKKCRRGVGGHLGEHLGKTHSACTRVSVRVLTWRAVR